MTQYDAPAGYDSGAYDGSTTYDGGVAYDEPIPYDGGAVSGGTVTGTGSAVAPAASTSGAGVVTVTGSGGATGPAASTSGAGTVTGAPVTGSGSASAPAAVTSGAGTVTVTGSGGATAPAGVTSGTDAVASTILAAPVLTDARLVSWQASPAVPERDLLRAPVETSARMRWPLTLASPPSSDVRTVERHAHLMPAMTAASNERQGVPNFTGTDAKLYRVERENAGRWHVLVDGVDRTWTRGKGALIVERASAAPVGPLNASVAFPQFKKWDRAGEGDWAFLDLSSDPQVDLVFRREDGTLEHRWEGFAAKETPGDPGLLVQCEGMFAQAQHAPWDPPVFMDETDIGWTIADALNGVKHRRWNKIPRVTTGITTIDRGGEAQNVWQYVQDLLSVAWTDDGRQWTLARVAPYTYRIQLKATTDVADWTVTYGAPGIDVRLERDQSVRRDAIYGRGYAKDGGFWCNRVFPGLEFGVPPQYPMDDVSLTLNGRSDATTDTGNGITTWQRKMRELGYPVTVDGVMNPADTQWIYAIQKARGLLYDGILGPQTWAATWENNSTDADTTSYRLPLAAKTEVMEWLYSASGAKVATNPANDPHVIAHEAPEIDFGICTKAQAKRIAAVMLDVEANPPWVGSITMDTDQWETGSTRFDIEEGHNVAVLGHPAGTVQVSDVSQRDKTVTLTVCSRPMDAMSLAAIRTRNAEARRQPSGRGGSLDRATLNNSQIVQYESESRAGFVPRTAVNGDVHLWTIRKTFVSSVGVAKVEFDATEPTSELVVALFNRPIRTSTLAALVPNPLSSKDGWYDNVDVLKTKYGCMEVFGTPGSPGGYWPRQKGDGPLTGKLRDTSSLLYDSPYGGFVWVAMFTSQSCWVEGRVYPAVPQ